jgi:hypothetical protein
MVRLLRRAFIFAAIAAHAVSAQTPSPVPVPDTTIKDPATQNVVTGFSIRSGKLALSSAANPGPVFLPDGTYTNGGNTVIVVVNALITRIQESWGAIIEVGSIRINRQRGVRLIPSTNALMTVSDLPLPSGRFKSEDGKNSFTIVAGRPTEFSFADSVGK